MTKLLVLDTETGGIDPIEHSLLSVGAVVWCDGKIGAEIEIPVLEDPLVVTARAMEINRIDLRAHGKSALPPAQATKRLLAFVDEAFGATRPAAEKITIAGHNVGFDVGFLKRLFRVAGESYERTFSHRVLDTSSVLKFLALSGQIPAEAAASDVAFAHFEIEVAADARHSALGDARATALLLTRLLATQPASGRRVAA